MGTKGEDEEEGNAHVDVIRILLRWAEFVGRVQ